MTVWVSVLLRVSVFLSVFLWWLTFRQPEWKSSSESSELWVVSRCYKSLVVVLIGRRSRDVISRLSVKPWCYWLWRPWDNFTTRFNNRYAGLNNIYGILHSRYLGRKDCSINSELDMHGLGVAEIIAGWLLSLLWVLLGVLKNAT